MKKNMGSIDQIVRIVVAVIVVALYFTHVIEGTLGIVLLALAGIFLVTGFVRFCPLYMVCGLDSSGNKGKS